MAEVDLKVVEEKLGRNEKLTPAELKEIMSIPPEDPNAGIAPEDDISEDDLRKATASEKDKKKEEPKKDPEKKAEDKPKEEPKAKEEPKKEEPKKETPAAAAEPDMTKINLELDKPDGQIDLKGYSDREKGIFWELRRERKGRQVAEAERDVLKRKELLRDKQDKDKQEKEEEDIFKDRDPNDPLTVKDIKALQERGKKAAEAKKKNIFDPDDPLVGALMRAHDNEARRDLGEDYDVTVECTAEIISNNPVYLRQIAEAMYRGENIAKLTYQLIKGDPEYTKVLPVAKARLVASGKLKESDPKKEEPKIEDPAPGGKKAADVQKELEDNKTKTKTSAHVEGSDKPTGHEGYTLDQLMNMSDQEFAKVPKKIREAFLKGDVT